ncbi:triphosphoribosyl-dephospho-CoA synthase CitG [Erysipelothrix sp. HDW6A]|uniref:triphosphoribosyl-dephospho-CoA synthase CitG n=1 Tax=Erysipelothrix sp. HDW6A TaxID=2714928 RepID=UPI00140E8D27|nr:triphosphoribosyl-dephospho-CoA synthase CitG [Erysipelothrix sp. HDW6A]QIK56926.1 triphosphoribosyl-dephospho-CoA synthase CitG [Erysipelothrix sp. HDW6A]
MQKRIVDLAIQALLDEASLEPKPGLVDPLDAGSHTDMNYDDFVASAYALKQSFENYLLQGLSFNGNQKELFNSIRSIGMDAEHDMYQVTNNVNTHKGANFLFGIILSAIGYGNYPKLDTLITIIQEMTEGLVYEELEKNEKPKTYGEILYHEHGIKGIRGEVEEGLPTVMNHSLPIMMQDKPTDLKVKEALLKLIEQNVDTNMLKRGGIEGLELGQELASSKYLDINDHLSKMNRVFKKHNLSPGGSADLLAVTIFLYNYDRMISTDKA